MKLNKRSFLKLSCATGVATIVSQVHAESSKTTNTSTSSLGLKNITTDAAPISVEERLTRIKKAQALMARNNIEAIILEPGSTMDYFTGIQWRRSERLTCVIIPKEGDIGVITPYFEEPSVKEKMQVGNEILTWHEHENPFNCVINFLVEKGITKGRIGFESTVRYFVHAGIMSANANLFIVPAEPVTAGCRMFKSVNEISLMRKANEVTLMAYQAVWNNLDKGMSAFDVTNLMQQAQTELGGQGIWNMALLNESSAYPHGTDKPQVIKEGSIVLMDCGCHVQGYQSDISRTFVFGEANKKQKKIWNTVRKGQDIAFETAQIGTQAGKVDDAVRKYYESQGFGPGYKTPGLSHRTGHGIGMDGHESANFVHGEKTLLGAGMCFSNEPGIYIFEEFGVRLEDCIYMTKEGPQWFTQPPESLDNPIGKMG